MKNKKIKSKIKFHEEKLKHFKSELKINKTKKNKIGFIWYDKII